MDYGFSKTKDEALKRWTHDRVLADLLRKGGLARAGLTGINELVEEAIAKFSALHPEAIAPQLAAGLKAMSALIAWVTASDLTPREKCLAGFALLLLGTLIYPGRARTRGEWPFPA